TSARPRIGSRTRRSRSMPSTSPSPLWRGWERRTLLNRLTRDSSEASRKRIRARGLPSNRSSNDVTCRSKPRLRTSTTIASLRGSESVPSMRSRNSRTKVRGRLSTTYQPNSSRTFEAVPFPAPDIPLTRSSSGPSPCSSTVSPRVVHRSVLLRGRVFHVRAGRVGARRVARVRRARGRPQRGADGLRDAGPDPRDLAELLHTRRAERGHRVELLQQGRTPGRAEAGDVVEHRTGHALRPTPAVRADRAPVRLVAEAMEQEQALAVAGEDHRLLLAGEPDLLESFGDPDHGDVVDAQFHEHLGRGLDLGAAAVHHEELRGVREPP